MGGHLAPGANEEYLLYQTLVGIWPFEEDGPNRIALRDRVVAYMTKALREAKVHTSWVRPDEEYENAVTRFVDAILDRQRPSPFLQTFLPFQKRVAELGIYNSLAQLLIKMTAPGVPDFYQGTELWDLSLVDPDNRRAVDYAERTASLESLNAGADVDELFATRANGRIKQFAIARALATRAAHRDLYERGEYVPLETAGAGRECLFAFARRLGDRMAITCVPRLIATLTPDASAPPFGAVWGDTRVLPSGVGVGLRGSVHGRDGGSRARRRGTGAPGSGRVQSLPCRAARSGGALMLYLTIIGGAFIAWLILVVLFTPHVPYHIEAAIDGTSDHFIHVLESTCHTTLENSNKADVFTNGDHFYPAMLEAIRGARETINLECYIFKKGEIGQQFVDALAERAKAGVRTTIVMDAIGSFGAFRASAGPLRKAGCRVEPYHRLSWYSLARLNNRTHRELLVVDGTIAFVGGAGVADWWAKALKGKRMWRDMMVRVEGPVVSDIQGVVAENWLECCGEILTGPETYKPHRPADGVQAFAIKSSPADRSTASRVLFQTLVEGATRHVLISTPYFLPRQSVPRCILPHGGPRNRDRRHRAWLSHRSALGAPGEPADVRGDARSTAFASSSTSPA